MIQNELFHLFHINNNYYNYYVNIAIIEQHITSFVVEIGIGIAQT